MGICGHDLVLISDMGPTSLARARANKGFCACDETSSYHLFPKSTGMFWTRFNVGFLRVMYFQVILQVLPWRLGLFSCSSPIRCIVLGIQTQSLQNYISPLLNPLHLKSRIRKSPWTNNYLSMCGTVSVSSFRTSSFLGIKSCFNSVPIPHYYFFFVMIVECFLKTIQFLTCNTRQTHKSHCYTKMRDFRKYFQT